MEIIIGADMSAPDMRFGPAEIRTWSAVLSQSPVGEELPVDTFTATLSADRYGALRDMFPGTPVHCVTDQRTYTFYLSGVSRQSRLLCKLEAVSVVGLLDRQSHAGGIYKGTPLGTIATAIFGGIPYGCEPGIAQIPVYGWLPADTARKNLHQLLLATGTCLRLYGVRPTIAYSLSLPRSTPITISDHDVYYGGSVDEPPSITQADVTEHTFVALDTDREVTLYDNVAGLAADHTVVTFRTPVHNLRAAGELIVHQAEVNFAVISGTGQLFGHEYTHVTRVVSAQLASMRSNVPDHRVRVSDCYLVSVLNSRNVARRILGYYSTARSIKNSIVVADAALLPGAPVALHAPYGAAVQGYLTSMVLHPGSWIKADCEIAADYIPKYHGNQYSRCDLLSDSGTINITGDVMIVLISGGQGGQSGGTGEPGTATAGGKGGKPGSPGLGAKILCVDAHLTGPTSYRCGLGGVGGMCSGPEPVPGADGGDTIFGDFSSASGVRSTAGVTNILTGYVYGRPSMKMGIAGGMGSGPRQTGSNITYRRTTYHPGRNGDKGYGGGAAAGANGGAASGNRAGAGAEATCTLQTGHYGGGGAGGNGGGGGGAGENSKGGQGSMGEFGGPGLILLYH